MNRQNTVLNLTYVALYASLGVVLDYVSEFIPFLKMPNGGSISLAVIAVFTGSYHLGYKKGVAIGLLWWLIGLMFSFNSWYLNPIQYLLDYIIPMSVIGLAPIFSSNRYYIGILVTGFIRTLANIVSGAYFYMPDTEASGSLAAWIFSISYNSWYNIATIIVAIIFTPIVLRILKKANIIS